MGIFWSREGFSGLRDLQGDVTIMLIVFFELYLELTFQSTTDESEVVFFIQDPSKLRQTVNFIYPSVWSIHFDRQLHKAWGKWLPFSECLLCSRHSALVIL